MILVVDMKLTLVCTSGKLVVSGACSHSSFTNLLSWLKSHSYCHATSPFWIDAVPSGFWCGVDLDDGATLSGCSSSVQVQSLWVMWCSCVCARGWPAGAGLRKHCSPVQSGDCALRPGLQFLTGYPVSALLSCVRFRGM